MKRRETALGIGLVGVLAGLALHCSSSSSSSGSSTDCGPGPYAKLTGTVLEASASGPARPKEGVTITLSICSDKSFTTDATGVAVVNVTKATPMLLRLEHPDDLPEYIGEWQTSADFAGTAIVVPKSFQSIVAPGFGPDNTILALGVSFPDGTFDAGVPDGGASDPCQRSEGVSFSVPDHPEAKVAYYTEDTIPKPDTTLTATTKNGLASISNLADGVIVTPAATKAGCKLTGAHHGFTGRAQMFKGFVTQMQIQMTK